PTVALTGPANGASYAAPATMTVSASASDPDGTVSSVNFYARAQLIGSVNASPFSVTWSNVASGTYALTAIATDNAGASTTSAPVSVTVNANKPPSVSLTAPTSGATYVAPANVTVSASATDSDGTVKNVSFYAGAQLIGSVNAIPYSVTWNNVAAGSYTL